MGELHQCRCEPTRAFISFKEDGSGATWHKVTAIRHGHLQAS